MNPHRASLSRHPLAEIAVAFAVGICAANYFPTRLSVLFVGGAVCTAVVVIAVLKRRLVLAGVVMLVGIGVAGSALANQEAGDRRGSAGDGSGLREFAGKAVVVTGVLVGPPEFGRGSVYFTVGVEGLEVDGASRSSAGVVSLVAPFRGVGEESEYRRLQLRYGTRVRVAATLSRMDDYRNPGVSPLSEYLDRKGYDAAGVVKSPAMITRVGDFSVFPPLGWLYSWREQVQQRDRLEVFKRNSRCA